MGSGSSIGTSRRFRMLGLGKSFLGLHPERFDSYLVIVMCKCPFKSRPSVLVALVGIVHGDEWL